MLKLNCLKSYKFSIFPDIFIHVVVTSSDFCRNEIKSELSMYLNILFLIFLWSMMPDTATNSISVMSPTKA